MFETARPFLLSLAIGLVIGIERERAWMTKSGAVATGARTFTLLALLGTLAAHLEAPGIAVVIAAFVGVLVVAVYLHPAGASTQGVGATTEVAAMMTFALGYLAHEELLLTAMLAVITVGVLALKARIHEFAHEGLAPREVSAALSFLVIAFVVLPLLPDRAVDPWGLGNPFRLWLLFVLIAGMGFGGYIAVRALGPERGLAAAGFFAGLVSSTAATLSFARRARDEQALAGPLAVAIVLANVASAAAQILVAGIAYGAMTTPVFAVVGAAVLVGAVGALAARAVLARRREAVAPAHVGLESPLSLQASAKIAAGLAAFLVVIGVASRTMGSSGALAASALGGTVDVHAVTLGVATLAKAGSLSIREALLAILVAFLCNMAVKLGLVAWAGGRRLLLLAAPPMIAMAAAASAAFWLLPRI